MGIAWLAVGVAWWAVGVAWLAVGVAWLATGGERRQSKVSVRTVCGKDSCQSLYLFPGLNGGWRKKRSPKTEESPPTTAPPVREEVRRAFYLPPNERLGQRMRVIPPHARTALSALLPFAATHFSPPSSTTLHRPRWREVGVVELWGSGAWPASASVSRTPAASAFAKTVVLTVVEACTTSVQSFKVGHSR